MFSGFVFGFACPAATLIVSNTSDTGPGSFRQAIIDANNTNGVDTIVFHLSGPGVHTISPQSALPAIRDAVIIDGTTQPNFTNSPVIELNGATAGDNAALRLLAGNSTIRGLVINRFTGGGIRIDGVGTNVIQGNFIGTDVTGTIRRGNGLEGVYINGSWSNLVGGTNLADRNLLSGNADAGVYLLKGGANKVQGNWIGTTASGRVPLPNENSGIIVYDSIGNTIGGPAPGARNIISGNGGSGLSIVGAGSAGNLVQGNFIGTDLSGALLLANAGDGVTLSGGANLIGGTGASVANVIAGNGKAGVSITGMAGSNNLVQGNFIGTDVSGKLALGNTFAGITLYDGASGNLVGGASAEARNIISGNKQDGVFLTNSPANVVQGNYVGTDATGTRALGNAFSGITIRNAASNTVGGASAGAANVVSGNALDGIFVGGAAAIGNLLQGNLIGTDAGGTRALGNGRAGVGLSGAPGNQIGGGSPGAGNIISANNDAGIYLFTSGATGNTIQGNKLGTDATGMLPLGNAFEGIYAERAATNIIGGAFPGTGNLVAANHTVGILLTNASWNVIQGNLIGTAIDGLSPLGNLLHAVDCETGASNNLIGGPAGAGNRIAFSQTVYAGVRVRDGAVNNGILGNSIFANGGLGIDLGPFGPTPNDDCDKDAGGNLLQNFPVLAQAVSGNGTGIRGTLNSTGGRTFLLQFFASPMPDPSAYGEGQIFLGEKAVSTDANCTASFVVSLPATIPVGYLVTATATDSANNTSEFSAPLTVETAPALTVVSSTTNHILTFSWPSTPSGFALKQTGSLVPPVHWISVTNSPVLVNGRFQLTLPSSGNRFFALGYE